MELHQYMTADFIRCFLFDIPVFSGSNAVFTFEHTVKIRKVFKSGLSGDFQQRKISCTEHSCGMVKSVIVQIFRESLSRTGFKKFHKVRFTVIGQISDFFNRDWFGKMCFYMGEDAFHFF